MPVRHTVVELKPEAVERIRRLLDEKRISEALDAFCNAFAASEVEFRFPCGPGAVRGILPVQRGTGLMDLCRTEYWVIDPEIPGNHTEGRLEFHPGLVGRVEFRPEFRLLILHLRGGGELRFRGRELVRIS